MKRALFALLIGVIAAVGAWAQPKVAVLDAMIPQNMDPSVIVPATEKIIERLVVSGRFTVLDRANIESVLKEREFQVSGMVSDQDVVTAGKYLGADFVVVAKVSKVADTYFISAKMIAIKTGVIANQTSAQGEGKLSTLIDLAAQVGEVLSGGAVLAQSAAGSSKDISKADSTATKTQPAPQEPAPNVMPQPSTQEEKPKDKLKSTLLVSYGGTSASINFPSTNITSTGGIFDVYGFVPLFAGLTLVGNVDSVSFDYTSGSKTWTWNFIDAMGGVGYALKLGVLVPYADVKGGFTAGSESGAYSWSGTGGCFGFDLGMNFDLGRWLVLGLRYQYVNSTIDVESTSGTTVDMSSFLASVGVRF